MGKFHIKIIDFRHLPLMFTIVANPPDAGHRLYIGSARTRSYILTSTFGACIRLLRLFTINYIFLFLFVSRHLSRAEVAHARTRSQDIHRAPPHEGLFRRIYLQNRLWICLNLFLTSSWLFIPLPEWLIRQETRE